MQAHAHGIGDERTALLGAPDDVNQNVGQGLRHFVSPFQGLINFCDPKPRALPWAIMFSAFGADERFAQRNDISIICVFISNLCLSMFIRD
jgi:hypothetical protein